MPFAFRRKGRGEMEGGEDGGRVGETEGWKEGEGRRDKGWREEGEKESGKRVVRLI